MPRSIAVEEAFNIIQRVYAAFGWKPDSRSSREQRNVWLESAVAVVHYGHPTFNAAGGDPRWCIKNAGGGRPQSDDVIVLSTTRAYWDIIGSAGADNWGWSLTGHSEPLPPEQNVYAPSQAALPGGGPVPGPDPDPDPGPGPDPGPDPGDETERLILIAIGNLHAKVDHVISQNSEILAKLGELKQQATDNTETIGRWMVEQTQGGVRSVIGANPDGSTGAPLGPRIDAVKDAQCVLKRR